MVPLTVDIRGTCYYEILAENETLDATRRIFLKDSWTGGTEIRNKQYCYLTKTLDLIAMLQLRLNWIN